MKKILVFLVFLLSLLSCTIKLENYVGTVGESLLSIEGGITDQVEQQMIHLSMTYAGTSFASTSSPIKGAKIYVMDEKDAKIDYQEIGEGVYKTAEKISGRSGGMYKLHMEAAGNIYESVTEIMPMAAKIDSLSAVGTINNVLPITDKFRAGFNVYVDFKDPPEKGNYYRWTWRNSGELNVCKIDDYGGVYHCKNTCFDINYSQDVNLLTDDFINGQSVKGVFITRVPYVINEIYKFPLRYYLQVEQKSINKHTYDLFRQLKNTNISGSLFDVPALTPTNLNITCLNDASKRILGIFEVSSVRRKVININMNTKIANAQPTIIPLSAFEPSSLDIPCSESIYRTATAPDGW